MRPPLTTSMTGPLTTPSLSLISSIVPQARSYWARFLDRTRRPSLSSFWRTSASISSPSDDDLVRVDVVADRQLPGRDDALGLVADVEQDLVLVDLDDRAVDDLAVLDLDHRGVDGVGEAAAEVVLDDLAGGVLALAAAAARLAARRAGPRLRELRVRRFGGFGLGDDGGLGAVGQGGLARWVDGSADRNVRGRGRAAGTAVRG